MTEFSPSEEALIDFIEATAPAGPAGAAAKLRLLTDDDIAIQAGQPNEGEIASLKQVSEFIESLSGPDRQGRHAVSKTAKPEAPASAASLILIAARDLAKAWDDHNQLDKASLDLRKKRLEQGQERPRRKERALDAQMDTVSARANALEDLIGATRAATLGEATVQIALVISWLSFFEIKRADPPFYRRIALQGRETPANSSHHPPTRNAHSVVDSRQRSLSAHTAPETSHSLKIK